MSPTVMAVVEPVPAGLGSEPDPHAWIACGDERAVRFVIMALAPAGLAVVQ